MLNRQPRKRPFDRPSVTEQIESMPRIATHEMQWIKEPGKPLEKAALFRTKKRVYGNPFKLGKHEVATHPYQKKMPEGQAIPSAGDIRSIMAGKWLDKQGSFVKTGKSHAGLSVIASLNAKGTVMGYTVIKPTKVLQQKIAGNPVKDFRTLRQTYEAVKKAENEFLKGYKEGERMMKDTGFVTAASARGDLNILIDRLRQGQKEKFKKILDVLGEAGFRLRFVPMHGYEFNRIKATFDEK